MVPSLGYVTAKYVAFAHSIYSWQTSESIYNKVPFRTGYCPSGVLITRGIYLMSNSRSSKHFTDIPWLILISLRDLQIAKVNRGTETRLRSPRKTTELSRRIPRLWHFEVSLPQLVKHPQPPVSVWLFISPWRSLIKESRHLTNTSVCMSQH